MDNMALKVITHVEDGFGTVHKTIVAQTAEEWSMLQELFQRMIIVWPAAPPEMYDLATLVTKGRVASSYSKESKFSNQ